MVAKVVSTISPPSAVVVEPAPGSTVVVEAVLAVVEELSEPLEHPGRTVPAIAAQASVAAIIKLGRDVLLWERIMELWYSTHTGRPGT
ncbi:unannotated protein [freshwater metagenome]|uniref:Unannotated protein n=1 Tax=freshwater metagenome TaxID=449393 RepID=A0A6J7A8H6_9ZZZZ